MDERLRHWHPNREEVQRIVVELRPLIRQLARRDQEAIAAEIARRRKHAAEDAARAATSVPQQ